VPSYPLLFLQADLAFAECSRPFSRQLFALAFPNRGWLRRDRQTEAFGHPRSQVGVDRVPVAFDRALLDEALHPLAQVPDDVADQMVPIGRRHHLPVERAGLDEVVVVLVRHVGRAHDLAALYEPARIAVALRVGPRPTITVGRVDRLGVVVVVAHLAVLVVVVHLVDRPVDRQLLIVRAGAIAVRVAVGEQPPQHHPVRAGPDARDKVRHLEPGLLDLGEEVLGVAVEHHPADRDRRVVLVRPDLGQVERVEVVGGRVLVRHDLHLEAPGRVVLAGDRLPQVTPVVVEVLGAYGPGLGVGEVLDALLGLEVVLDPEPLARGVLPHIRAAAVAVHVAVGARRAPVAHQDRHLVGRLGRERPEVPLHVVAAQAGVGHTLLRVNEVGELHGVTHEEDRRVVADEVVVAFFGVELEGEAAHVAVRVRVALFGGHLRETREHRRALANYVEKGGFGPPGDIGGHLEVAEGTAALDVVHAIGDALADEVGQLLEQVGILQQHGTVGADRERGIVARRGVAGIGCCYWSLLFLFVAQLFLQS
jgi:hypothetical protein